MGATALQFLSIQAQDFIEDGGYTHVRRVIVPEFLSIQAQDFIEEGRIIRSADASGIPEHSSSGLH